jgi:hypothetical protein
MKRNCPSSALSRPAGKILLGLFLLASAGLVMTGDSAQDVKYGVGQWNPESGLGNHRVVVRVEAPPAPKPNPARGGTKKAAAVLALTKPAGRLEKPSTAFPSGALRRRAHLSGT